MACLRRQLAGAVPDKAGIYPVSLQGLRQGCIAARVPGADAPLQVSQYCACSCSYRTCCRYQLEILGPQIHMITFTPIVQMHYHCRLA